MNQNSESNWSHLGYFNEFWYIRHYVRHKLYVYKRPASCLEKLKLVHLPVFIITWSLTDWTQAMDKADCSWTLKKPREGWITWGYHVVHPVDSLRWTMVDPTRTGTTTTTTKLPGRPFCRMNVSVTTAGDSTNLEVGAYFFNWYSLYLSYIKRKKKTSEKVGKNIRN